MFIVLFLALLFGKFTPAQPFILFIAVLLFIRKKLYLKITNMCILAMVPAIVSTLKSSNMYEGTMTLFKYIIAVLFINLLDQDAEKKFEVFVIVLANLLTINLMIAKGVNSDHFLLKGNGIYSGVVMALAVILTIENRKYVPLAILPLTGTLMLGNRASIGLILFVILFRNPRFIIPLILLLSYIALKKFEFDEIGRVLIYKTAIVSFLKKPVFGWGPGMFSQAYEKNKMHFFGDSPTIFGHSTKFAHNQILEILTETGIITFLFIFIILIHYLKNSIKNVYFHYACGFMLISLFTIPFFHLFDTLIFSASCFFSYKKVYVKVEMKQVIYIMLFISGIFSTGKIAGALENHKLARKLDFLNPAWYMTDNYKDLLYAIELDSSNYDIYHRLAHSNPQNAKKYFLEAISKNPYDILIRIEYATFLLNRGYEKEALEVLKENIKLEPFAPINYRIYSEFLKKSKKSYYRYYENMYRFLKERKFKIKSSYEKFLTE